MRVIETARRAGQLARIGSAARKLRRASSDEERHLARERLRDLLSDARGVPMKVGQFLAASQGEDPLRTLVTGVEPVALERIVPEVEDQLGCALDDVFSSFEASRAAASLGQVHEATLRDGRAVAVKVRYPGIRQAVRAELRLAGLAPGAGPARKWGFDLDAYKTTLRDNMERELDYLDEAERQMKFASAVQVAGLVVPRVHRELCRPGLLVQDWHAGSDLSEAAQWSRRDRLHVARILLETLFTSVFRAGLVHGDPHPGNYRFSHTSDGRPQVLLYDYGCTVEISEPARLALLQLIVRLREGGELHPLRAFGAMGFDMEKLDAIHDSLPRLCELLFEPFTSESAFETRDWRLSERMAEHLGELRWWFRAAGPAQLFLLLRAFQGVVVQLQQLDVRLPWWPLLKRIAGDELTRRADELELPMPPASTRGSRRVVARAKLMKVRVTENDAEKLALAMPARQALELREIVPADVHEGVERAGVQLDALQRRVRDKGLVPQVLFEYREGPRGYRVWLE